MKHPAPSGPMAAQRSVAPFAAAGRVIPCSALCAGGPGPGREEAQLDHYRTLQVSRHAEPEVIEKAYKTLSLKYHPDVVAPSDRERATRHMQHINEAYRVLRDPVLRRRYDAGLPAEKHGRTAWDVFMDKGLVGMLMDKVGRGL